MNPAQHITRLMPDGISPLFYLTSEKLMARKIAPTTPQYYAGIAEAAPRKSFLQQADALINGDRQQDYGDKLQNFSQIAMLWQGTLAPLLGPDAQITPELVALCMIQVKVARLSKSPDHLDSQLDIAGYAGCYNKLQEERTAGAPLAGAIIDPRDQGV